ncbi:DoxX family protein [Paracoccus alkanivorans]|uniref:DoxX family protein n=1 Tax=Paracoccus alkanivorans TaxID=2116655 RepID=A0A3M0MKA8_9RHOB|nr:DoxX family membrane protein [Paracoccus alkanivorans]RMC36060.1 DoxX family protein [Paracoccus alkanivorans]
MEHLLSLLLTHPHMILLAKVILTSFFWVAGLFGLFNFKVIVQEMIDVNLPVPQVFALATIACQLGGPALLISNAGGLGWLGAGALAVFTILCIPVAHPFWKYEEPKRTPEFHIVLEHVTVVGGLMLAASMSILL